MGRKNGVCLGRCMCWRNHGGKQVICKKFNLSAVSGILGHFKSEFGKKRYVVIFPITRSGRVQKSETAFLLYPVIKRPKKEKRKYFFSFRELFQFLPEKMIRKCFGGNEKE